ncbi:type II CRISPR RNA-guided endonuclease Cas9 [Alphaproteobacteria bacterium]|nr:type II CRISPR RNA-guided endonuclease Cas9 [Alphaproteobacteria bacterium]
MRVKEARSRASGLERLFDDKKLSFGSFLHRRREQGLTVRARRNSDKNLYDVYPSRELLADEFNKILNKQAEYYPDILTDKVISHLFDIVFFQRKLKPQPRGMCSFYPLEFRTFRCMPSFQRYRMVQEVNALEWVDVNGKQSVRDHPHVRDEILDMMEQVKTQKGEVTFGNMKKVLKLHGLINNDVKLNFESPKRKGFDGNMTSKAMRHEDCVGPAWDTWSLEQQDDLIDKVFDSALEDEEVIEYALDNFGLSLDVAQALMKVRLLDGSANISLRAATKLYHEMLEHNLLQSDAVQKIASEHSEFVNPFNRTQRGELLDKLPYYGEAFQDGRHIIPGTRKAENKNDQLKYYGGVTNPTVHIALNQIRQVVNELMDRFGSPSSISIELARNLPEGKEGRAKIEKEQSENQRKNDVINEKLIELGIDPNRDNRLKLALWNDLSDDPNGRRCPFSGTLISISDLFNGTIEIEHLIPFSQSLDDSKANKTLCTRQANRDKGNRTPYEAFGHNPEGYDWEGILDRASSFPISKRWRFEEDAMESWLREHKDFSGRHLNDTRYIGRLTREYLENICPVNRIDVVTGRLTSLLRGHWGLNSILRGHNEPETTQPKKIRDDHRHHAIDAIVIAMTSRSVLQTVSSSARRAEGLDLEKLFVKNSAGHSAIEPWDGFRDEVAEKVRGILVSHKSRRKGLSQDSRKTDGSLHNETAYGIVSGPDGEGSYQVTHRKPLEWFIERKRVERIRDEAICKNFLAAWDTGSGLKESVSALQNLARKLNVKSCRIIENKKVIPIKDKSGTIYKAYDGNSNWAMEIYEYPNGHTKSGKWEGVVVQRFQANQNGFKPGQTFRPHPAAKLIMRLQINDVVEIEHDGEKLTYRVQLMTKGMLVCAGLNEANVDSRNRAPAEDFKYKYLSIQALQKGGAKKVHISPSGRKSYAKKK